MGFTDGLHIKRPEKSEDARNGALLDYHAGDASA